MVQCCSLAFHGGRCSPFDRIPQSPLIEFMTKHIAATAFKDETRILMNSSNIEIRSITDFDETKQIEEVQLLTWGMKEQDVIPARIVYALVRNGSCLLGAFDEGKMVGFVFGQLGTMEGLDERIDQVAAARLLMYSVTMGILPQYQRLGIGYRLKIAQREFALRIGVRLITWTFDPLESLNGYLNFGKLGVVCNSYHRNYYGPMSGINAGLPSDRLYVEWWVTSNRVKSRVSGHRGSLTLSQYLEGGAKIINDCDPNEQRLLIPPASFLKRRGTLLLVQIPENIQSIKSSNKDLAYEWRMHLRELFEYYFANEYLVTDFVRDKNEEGSSRSYYLLTRARA